jgi:serine/threonine protein kinase
MAAAERDRPISMEDTIWNELKDDYTIKDVIGKGAFGTVVKAVSLKTGQTVAIKLMTNIQKDAYILRKVLRELIILRKLSEIKDNIFTTKVIDVIVPEACFKRKRVDSLPEAL